MKMTVALVILAGSILVLGTGTVGLWQARWTVTTTGASPQDDPSTFVGSEADWSDPEVRRQRWVISARGARALLASEATVLDARACGWGGCQRLQGTIPIAWQDFTPTEQPNRGQLLPDHGRLSSQLQDLGIDRDRPVLVFGDPLQGWGEEGRIVWMLRSLGQTQTLMVDGGFTALVEAGWPVAPSARSDLGSDRDRGSFTVERQSEWSSDREAVRQHWLNQQGPIIDTREPREYAGATPYGERRGGHIPGAIHLYYRDLLDERGRLLPRDAIAGILTERGLSPGQAIVLYCTGGVRSAWLTVVLADLGWSVRNYPGSMWDWSAGPPDRYPLTVKSGQKPPNES